MESLNRRKNQIEKTGSALSKTNKRILPVLVAVGGACGLAAAPVSALELGELRISSALGEPLRASIAYALHPNEQISESCIFLQPNTGANGIPGVGDPRITLTESAIVLSGGTPIREPLLAMRLSVKCPYSAILARDYTLFIDLPLPTNRERVALSNDGVPLAPAQTSSVTATDFISAQKPAPAVPARALLRDESPIASSGRYRVQPGDTLSQIASRIDGRSIALWPAVDAIFAANPDAFLNNDRDLLLAGAWLIIPEMTGASPLVTNLSASEILPDTGLADDASRVAYNGVATPDIDSQPALIEEAVTVVEPAAATVAKPATPAMRPVDIAVKADDTYGPPAPEVVVDIPDTVIQAPQGAQPAPAIVNTDPDATWSWSWWFGGAGFTLIFALLLFRRQIRDRFRAVAVSVLSVMSRPHDDKPAPRSIVPNIDFRFDAETGNSGSMTLDADLGAGTGLQHTADGAVAREFGLSTSGETDNSVGLEKQEQAADEEEQQQTDVIPATPKKKDTILVNEVLATGGVTNVDYDISMMADLVERVVEDDDATVEHIQTISGNKGNSSQGTPGNDFEREIFEKDYEDAAIATGVFSKDMLEDVRGLAEGVGDDDFVGDTAEMPVSQETAITAELAPNFPESGNAEIDELDFSPDNAEPEGNLDTVEFDHLAFKKSKAG